MSACTSQASDDVKVVSPSEFNDSLKAQNVYLLDVRTPEEFAEGHLPGAHQLNWLDPEAFKQGMDKLPKDDTILLYCRSGKRSNRAAHYLARNGYRVIDLDGGIGAWEKANLPISK